ncbi:MAG: Flp pilus assembly protein CpaB [Myxococcaceae bacterium]
MEWRSDIGPARQGDAAARERLREYLTPFVHAICLAHAPHHETLSLVPRILTEAMGSLGGVDDADVGAHVMATARRRTKEAMAGKKLDELPSADPTTQTALQTVARLRELPELPREHFFLRAVDGIPGPEIAEVARLTPGDFRSSLERAAAEASRVLGQAQSFAGDDYLWELSGAPPALLVKLEVSLPLLRFDPLAAPPPAADAATAGTAMDLNPVGARPKELSLGRGLVFDERDDTSVGEVHTEPGVDAVAPPPPVKSSPSKPALTNPFEQQVRTIAATDLPAEAKGNLPPVPTATDVPWVDPSQPSSSKSGRMGPLPARPVPNPREGESSGKSNSNKSGRQQQIAGETSGKKVLVGGAASSASSKFPPLEVTKDAPKITGPGEEDSTEAKVPAAIARAQQPNPGAVTAGSGPESVLGQPTMEMSLAEAIQGATRLNPIPVTSQETRVAALPTTTNPVGPPPLSEASWTQGTTPFFVAGACVLLGLAIWGAVMLSTTRTSRANWQLTEVVVAAEDLNTGDEVTLENVALRSVPEPYHGMNVVKGDAMDFILGQKMAVAVQSGDPLFYSQFVSNRAARALSTRISKKGRGYTISTNVISSVGNWVKPGDLVDVLVTINATDTAPKGKGKNSGPRAVTILQHVRVLATGKADDDLTEAVLDERERAYSDVTLLLTAPEAEVIALGSQLGRLTLSLRNEEDTEVDLTRAYTNINTLLSGEQVKVMQRKRFDVIKTIRNAPPAEEKKSGFRRPELR